MARPGDACFLFLPPSRSPHLRSLALFHRFLMRSAALTIGLFSLVGAATAGSIVEFEMAGSPGTQMINPASFEAAGANGLDLIHGAGLTGFAGNNSMNTTGWNGPNPDDFYAFGFDLDPGLVAVVSSMRFATRSSGTGPGFVNVLYSVDGGPETLITTLVQGNATFLNSILNFGTAVEVKSSFEVILRSANNTAANGGTVGSAGTLRIGDYLPPGGNQAFQPIKIEGVISAAVPEPSTILLSGAGVALIIVVSRRRRISG
jgi:PEP-CTERM motif